MLQPKNYHKKLSNLLESPDRLQAKVGSYSECPPELSHWLGKLKLLYGVPLNYLIADEQMLPPESIRFFHIDPNWTSALIDGAFSIGRSPTARQYSRSFLMDKASTPMITSDLERKATAIRAQFLGIRSKVFEVTQLSGFLLRSAIVKDCPGIGVHAYPAGGVPNGDNPGTPLSIVRMETVHPDSDTLICIIEGDACRIDIHEAPEALHYGIDSYSDQTSSGRKTIYPFRKDNEKGENTVTMEMEKPIKCTLNANEVFRAGNGLRIINMSRLAEIIGKEASPTGRIDASEMGFEMTEGVGMVSFLVKK